MSPTPRPWPESPWHGLLRQFLRSRARQSRQPGARLAIESLEDRNLLSFLPAVNYPVGTHSYAVTVADLNNDGIADLAVPTQDHVALLFGNGDGTFQPPQSVPVYSPHFVAVGDFNGDGIPDLAVAGDGGVNQVSVLLGNGDGTFQAPTNYAVGPDPIQLVVGDFTGTGILDLAVANLDNSTVSVLLGNGDGTFQPAQTYAVGPGLNGIAVGDFTGTGILDLVAVNYNYFGTVNVLMGNGDGTFQPAVTYPTGPLPYSVAVGDLTGNGIQDLVVPVFNVDQQTTGVSVLLGNGDGTFQAPVTYAAGPGGQAVSVAIADFTGDGIPEIAVTQVGFPGSVSVLEGNGDGTFQPPPTSYAVGIDPRLMAVGDFNGDGFPDLAVSNWNNGADSTVSVLLNAGDGTPAPSPAHHTALAAPTARSFSAAPLSAPLAVSGLQASGPLTVSATGTPTQPAQAAPANTPTLLSEQIEANVLPELPVFGVRDARDPVFAGWEDLRTEGLLGNLV